MWVGEWVVWLVIIKPRDLQKRKGNDVCACGCERDGRKVINGAMIDFVAGAEWGGGEVHQEIIVELNCRFFDWQIRGGMNSWGNI